MEVSLIRSLPLSSTSKGLNFDFFKFVIGLQISSHKNTCLLNLLKGSTGPIYQ